MNAVAEKKHRLPLENYRGILRATFTLCIKEKKATFTSYQTVDEFLEILNEVKDKYNCKNWVYIFMPDHLHLLLEGNTEKSDLWKTITLFKQKTGFWFSQNKPEIEWQKDFYDHVHRKDGELKKQMVYILENPVRKELVTRWEDYPFKGSLDFDLKEIVG